MSIFDSWLQSKEYESTYRPTMLYRVDFFAAGNTAYFTSANNLVNTDLAAGVTWNDGHVYLSRVKNQNIGQLQMAGGLGTDIFGSISIQLIDPKGDIFANERSLGFQGGTLTATFALYDPMSNLFSPDSKVIFQGMLDAAEWDGSITTLTATSTYSLVKSVAPPMPVQRRCPFSTSFPATFSQRLDGAFNALSPYWNCGYSPDVTGGVGTTLNQQNGSSYESCSGSLSDCKTRGMYDKDSQGRLTRRFGGIQYTPPATWKGKSYTQGKTITGVNCVNEAKWSQYVPITYGTSWVTAVCANVWGDANSTVQENICGYTGYGAANDAQWADLFPLVVVNGLLTPNSSRTSDVLFRWYGRADGNRTGFINTVADPIDGDPYGSMLMIQTVVYQQIANSNAPLDVRVLVPTRAIPVYSAPGAWSGQRTDLLAWVIYDIIRIARPDLYARIDVRSVINYAGICGANINYRKSDGSTGAHRRYGCSLTIDKATSVAQVIEGLKIAGKLLIVPSSVLGTGLKFLCKQGLADQQPSPMPGSNDNTPHTSTWQGGGTSVGYVAYAFDDSNIISARSMSDKAASTPCLFTAAIQDEDNDYIQDTVTVADNECFNRIQMKNTAAINGIGFPNYDQAYRVIKTKMAETYRGNPTGLPAGTIRWAIQSTFRGASVNLGDIVSFSSTRMNQPWQLFRVEGIAPTPDFASAMYVLRWHSDLWYTDAYGQQ